MASAVTVCPQCGQRNRVPAAASGMPRCGKCREALPWISDAGDGDFAGVVEEAPLPEESATRWSRYCSSSCAASSISLCPHSAAR